MSARGKDAVPDASATGRVEEAVLNGTLQTFTGRNYVS